MNNLEELLGMLMNFPNMATSALNKYLEAHSYQEFPDFIKLVKPFMDFNTFSSIPNLSPEDILDNPDKFDAHIWIDRWKKHGCNPKCLESDHIHYKLENMPNIIKIMAIMSNSSDDKDFNKNNLNKTWFQIYALIHDSTEGVAFTSAEILNDEKFILDGIALNSSVESRLIALKYILEHEDCLKIPISTKSLFALFSDNVPHVLDILTKFNFKLQPDVKFGEISTFILEFSPIEIKNWLLFLDKQNLLTVEIIDGLIIDRVFDKVEDFIDKLTHITKRATLKDKLPQITSDFD